MDWSAKETQKKWSTEDQLKYYTNKRIAEGSEYGSDAYKKANSENIGIRSKYGVTEDNYGADAAYDAFKYNTQSGDNPYLRKAEDVDFNVDKRGVESAKKNLENFQYNPNEDETFKAYRDQAMREAESAGKSTLNQLNSTNLGRGSSYSAAAVGQVKQAYMQKVGEKSAELAELAYQKLLDKFNIERDMYETEYARRQNEFDRNVAMADNEFNRFTTMEQLGMNRDEHDKRMQWYDTKEQDAHDANVASIEGQKIANKYAPAQYESAIESATLENAAHYVDIDTAYKFLANNGKIDGSGNCTVMRGGVPVQMTSAEVAAGLAGEMIDIDDYGNLVYIG